jgi:N-terminal half of MaoC dehydratase
MINPDSVGRTYAGAKSTTISQSEITQFAAVFGEPNNSVATPTFSIRVSLDQLQEILTGPEVGINWERVVHGDQKFEIHRPIVAGDVLTCDATIETYRLAAGNEFINVRSDLHNDDELVCTNWCTIVVRA